MLLGERVSDRLASAIGSWKFLIFQSCVLTAWVAANALLIHGDRWDPYPFILLNLFLSFQAAYASPIILMAQKRTDHRDRAREIEHHMMSSAFRAATELTLERLDEHEKAIRVALGSIERQIIASRARQILMDLTAEEEDLR